MADLSTKEKWWAEVRLRTSFLTETESFEESELGRLIFGDAGCPTDLKVSDLLLREVHVKKRSGTFAKGFEGRDSMTVEEAIKDMISKEDPKLWWVFQAIWEDAPDSRAIHSWTMWHAFCDLCSEGPAVLFPRMEEESGA